ncbi:hypothetical protein K9M79_07570 [Candidatus Woesearchaeota archaeon]|nr:hypothetical protein [Candidatus Woesearchaeota archaeon]
MSKIIGHRGCRGREPENTILGIKAAFEAGADGVEIDIQMSKDRQLMVIHDDTLERTTNGSGLVHNYTANELQVLDAGKGSCIPTLKEVIGHVKTLNSKRKFELFIEIKCDGVEEQLSNIVKGLQWVTVKSFDHRRIQKFKESSPGIKAGLLMVCRPIDPAQLVNAVCGDFLSVNINFADDQLIEQCHAAGIKVFVWNANDKATIDSFRGKADYIGTDYP